MAISVRVVASVLAMQFFLASPGWAQAQHVVGPAELAAALDRQHLTDTANRAAVKRALDRPEARAAADRLGVDLERANAALSRLSGDELAELARTAETATTDLAGGQTTIVISLTTLLLIIIVILLVAD
jgi:hypothetical protein